MPLVLHPVTERHFELASASPAHTILLAGPSGVGKTSVARALAERLLTLQPGKLDDYPYVRIVGPVKGTMISIETVRELERFLHLKVPSKAEYNRLVIIEDSQKLSLEAQNALLKTLEEPPIGTIIILTVDKEQSLLPTIRSRSALIAIKAPTKQQLASYFLEQGKDDKQIQQAYTISGGLPGLMQAILHDDAEHPLLVATDLARQLLGQTMFGRLLLVDQLAKDKQLTLDTLIIMQLMARLSLRTAEGATAKKWQAVMIASYQAHEAISYNASAKLTLSNLMLQF